MKENLSQRYYVFSDLDGTLGMESEGIPPRNKQAIKAFVERGGNFGICTGRAPGSAREFLQDVPVSVSSVVNGGCSLYDFETEKVWDELFVPEQAIDFALQFIESFPGISLIVVNKEGYWQVDTGKISALGQRYLSLPIEEISKPWYRIIFAAHPKDTPQIAKIANKQKPDGVRIEYTAPDFVEIMNERAGKYEALKRMCESKNIPLSQVIYVGDFYNDLEVFQHVGIAVCVANAPKEVKKSCTWILPECMDGAVATLIEKLGINKLEFTSEYNPFFDS